MKIAQIAPLYESVPPQFYGGTERVVSYLTEELVAQGHDVTLFASGDSVTSANLVSSVPGALRLHDSGFDPAVAHLLMHECVARRADEFDLLHFHTDYAHFPLLRRLDAPHLTTLHGRLNGGNLLPIYEEFADLPFVSISDRQRYPLPHANWLATVPHGLPRDLLSFGQGNGGYLAFLGRISPEKRPDRAIEIARRLGVPLRIAAKVSDQDREYFERVIAPLLGDSLVEFIGEIGEDAKATFLGEARALVFPIDWEEPFGMAMIESLACGTPVVAFRAGSVPEVIDEGITGNIVESIDEAVYALERIDGLSRGRCREIFEQRFTAERMATDYLDVYERVLAAPGRVGGDAAVAGVLPGAY